MTLETFSSPDDLYLARGKDVNIHRPLFTGDVLAEVAIPGVQERGLAIVIAHPCSMRGPEARLAPTVLMAAVREHDPVGREAWRRQHYRLMPLPNLTGSSLHVGHLDEIGRAATSEDVIVNRRACLSEVGINLLQQRLIWHLTRLAVPTFKLQEAFGHTHVEADLLEEWTETLASAGIDQADAAARFEQFLRGPIEGGRNRQGDLRDPQRRSAVRTACRLEAQEIAEATE